MVESFGSFKPTFLPFNKLLEFRVWNLSRHWDHRGWMSLVLIDCWWLLVVQDSQSDTRAGVCSKWLVITEVSAPVLLSNAAFFFDCSSCGVYIVYASQPLLLLHPAVNCERRAGLLDLWIYRVVEVVNYQYGQAAKWNLLVASCVGLICKLQTICALKYTRVCI